MIVGIWYLAHRYGNKAAIIGGATLVLIIAVCIVIADFGLAGGFDPVHEVTFTVTGEGEAQVEYYIANHEIANREVVESITLPWTITITTKKSEIVRVYGEEGVKNLSCSIEEDGRHWLTYPARSGTTIYCQYYPWDD